MAKTDFQPIRRGLAIIALAAVALAASCGNRVSPAPKPQLPPPFEFLGAWGVKGQGPGQLDAPVSFAADLLGNVFFAEPGLGFVHKFHSNGTPLLSFQETSVRHAAGIAVDSGGAIYIANAQQGNILVFFPDGTFLQSWRGAAQRHCSGPLGFSIDEGGDRGHLLKFWPAPQKPIGNDERPTWVSAGADNFVYVAYFSSGRVEKFSSDGSWVTTWRAANAPSGESGPITGFATAGNFLFTIAPSSSEICVWTTDGQHKLDADLGSSIGKIAAPLLAVTPRAELLVFDPSAPKVFRFRMHLEDHAPL
jgi:hypothetical protein